ncbi:MAG: hypothetical protein OXU23_06730 [Candidatus Poribacteria bacterium]|nr:hypothetical protein [Candidatus Poribacteria bacterium]
MPLSKEDKTRLFGALRSELYNLSVQNIRNTVAAAGFDVSQITAKAEARSGVGSRSEVMPAVDQLFGQMSESVQETALRILAERLTGQNSELDASTQDILGSHGYQFIDGNFVPVQELDAREAQFIPPSAATEIGRAMSRLIEGDYSGAITSACGAVDLVTQAIYEKHDLGDPGHASFQTKVNTAFKRLCVFENMEREFVDIGMKPDDASALIDEMKKASNHAAQALQVLRRTMGDPHGSKPALRQTAYDAVKWSSAICGLLERSVFPK